MDPVADPGKLMLMEASGSVVPSLITSFGKPVSFWHALQHSIKGISKDTSWNIILDFSNICTSLNFHEVNQVRVTKIP